MIHDDRRPMKLIAPSSTRLPKNSKKPINNLPTPEMTSAATISASASDVALRAYYTYQNQGAGHGYDVDHWHAAEAELNAENGHSEE